MRIQTNTLCHTGLPEGVLDEIPFPSIQVARPSALLARCPIYEQTPMIKADALAANLGIGAIWLKDERARLNLGSFKALGAAYVIANMANERDNPVSETSLSGITFVTASAGNHGISVARGAQIFGAQAVVYISQTVPEEFAGRLASYGANVIREGADYEASMIAAANAAQDKGWTLLSDSSWDGYVELPHALMEGYLVLAEEAVHQIEVRPTHIFLQAGVGGMAGSIAAYFRKVWGSDPIIVVVEPEAAPALFESIAQKAPVDTTGPASNMGRLDCKTPSFIGLKGLARDANHAVLISDAEASSAQDRLAEVDCATSASGAAGVAGLIAAKEALELGPNTRALAIITEIAQA